MFSRAESEYICPRPSSPSNPHTANPAVSTEQLPVATPNPLVSSTLANPTVRLRSSVAPSLCSILHPHKRGRPPPQQRSHFRHLVTQKVYPCVRRRQARYVPRLVPFLMLTVLRPLGLPCPLPYHQKKVTLLPAFIIASSAPMVWRPLLFGGHSEGLTSPRQPDLVSAEGESLWRSLLLNCHLGNFPSFVNSRRICFSKASFTS